ncbi:MAG: hypothetical protein J7L32_01210, partial [Thermoplasmata archaeon]|nr:hypothetical protein [Thermoplasmata archaeon]
MRRKKFYVLLTLFLVFILLTSPVSANITKPLLDSKTVKKESEDAVDLTFSILAKMIDNKK